jgi:transposase
VIPQRADQEQQHRGRPIEFDKQACRERDTIERCIGWLKECRRIATRFENLAVNALAMIKVAILERQLEVDFADRA